MAHVLTSASTITCAHQGKLPVTGTAKVSVDGRAALVATDVIGQTAAAPCPVACTVAAITAGLAAKLSSATLPVLLDTLAATGTDRYGAAAKFKAIAGQTKLQAT